MRITVACITIGKLESSQDRESESRVIRRRLVAFGAFNLGMTAGQFKPSAFIVVK
jgi:hypothetical protein